MRSKCVTMAILATLLGGCMFDSHTRERTTLIEYRVGLQDASLAHGSLVLPTEHVKIEVNSDIGLWVMQQAVRVLP